MSTCASEHPAFEHTMHYHNYYPARSVRIKISRSVSTRRVGAMRSVFDGGGGLRRAETAAARAARQEYDTGSRTAPWPSPFI